MTTWAADSHVHFHRQFSVGDFFDSCFRNLTRISSSSVRNGILFFTEGWNEDYFDSFRSLKSIASSINNKIQYTVQNVKKNSFEVQWVEKAMTVISIQGYQIVSREKIEVLSLGTSKRIPDGELIEDVISEVHETGGIAVIPWGFGKWMGNRGRIMDKLITNNRPQFFIGDNGGRTSLIPYPKQFIKAKSKGIKILPGSDPLPFSSEVNRPLSFGFTFEMDEIELDPWNSIKSTLLKEDFSFNNFGKLTSPFLFAKNQISMQLKKRSSK